MMEAPVTDMVFFIVMYAAGHYTSTMSFVGNTIFRPYGKRKEALLYRKCRL